ncbi:MAG: hypothetical protein IT286_03330 [Proteobacteria bacterium]|nr:hypothetical protein [Pseudomonadota bacterium]
MKKNSGQLAVGLAFAFAGILAMFGLVFQSSLNTVDKAKLQTTSDYATLMASQNQAANLNKIRDINEMIQIAFATTQTDIQPSFAQLYSVANAYGVQLPLAIGAASGATLGQVTGGTCNELGQGVDKWYRNKLISTYTTARNQGASAIVTIVRDSNEYSYQHALDYFLQPDGLPHGMYMKLKQTLGESFNVAAVKGQYENGSLTNNDDFSYEILDENREDPLFIPQNEPRTFTYVKYTYMETNCCTPQIPCVCCKGPMIGPPGATPSNARVTKATDDVSYFFAGIRYTPALSIIQKMFKINVKNTETESSNFGQDVSASAAGEERLIRAREKNQRTTFQVFSAAKPYGGTYPESGNMLDSTGLSGSTGDPFQGAKLFGIADINEIGGIRIHRADGTIATRDFQGNINGELPFYAEDFLH